MKQGITLKLENFDKGFLSEKFKGLEDKLQDRINTFGQNVAETAKQMAPVDEGFLRGQIGYKKLESELGIEIVCNAEYAAYLEFGTRKFAAAYVATLPADWQTFAAGFKGKGPPGTFDEFVMKLVRWVRLKGIGGPKIGKQSKEQTDYATAYEIAHWIMIVGIRPHPFFYPAIQLHTKEFIDSVKKLLNA